MSMPVNLHTRAPIELADRADEVADALTRRTGVRVTRPAVVRRAIEIGLVALEREAGFPPPEMPPLPRA